MTNLSNFGAFYKKSEDRIITTRRAPGLERGVKLFDAEIADVLGRSVSAIRERRRVLRADA